VDRSGACVLVMSVGNILGSFVGVSYRNFSLWAEMFWIDGAVVWSIYREVTIPGRRLGLDWWMLDYHRDIAKRHMLQEPWYMQLIVNSIMSLC
jgi:hypothetical protein